MPRPAARPSVLAGRVFRGSAAVRAGHLTARQLQSSGWRRVIKDVYVDAEVPLSHGVCVTAAMLVLPPTAVIAGRSAAWLRGAENLVDPGCPVEILVPRAERFGPVAGLGIHTAVRLDVCDVDEDRGVRLTMPGRTAVDVARWSPSLTEAVVALDAMLAARAVGPRQLATAVHRLAPRGRVKRAAALADGRSESPCKSWGGWPGVGRAGLASSAVRV